MYNPFLCKFIGLNFILMFLARFLFFWIGVLILRLGISEFSAICFYDWFSIDIVSLLFAWIFDSNNCLAWNSLCESRDMLLEQCLKQCLWTVILQKNFCFLNWLFINNFELGGLYWPSMIVVTCSIVGLVFCCIFRIIRI